MQTLTQNIILKHLNFIQREKIKLMKHLENKQILA